MPRELKLQREANLHEENSFTVEGCCLDIISHSLVASSAGIVSFPAKYLI